MEHIKFEEVDDSEPGHIYEQDPRLILFDIVEKLYDSSPARKYMDCSWPYTFKEYLNKNNRITKRQWNVLVSIYNNMYETHIQYIKDTSNCSNEKVIDVRFA
tara:strand:+ start:1156 stop:1461 length:306 start_codon:yes stop_codon:yes gene_type:complete